MSFWLSFSAAVVLTFYCHCQHAVCPLILPNYRVSLFTGVQAVVASQTETFKLTSNHEEQKKHFGYIQEAFCSIVLKLNYWLNVWLQTKDLTISSRPVNLILEISFFFLFFFKSCYVVRNLFQVTSCYQEKTLVILNGFSPIWVSCFMLTRAIPGNGSLIGDFLIIHMCTSSACSRDW